VKLVHTTLDVSTPALLAVAARYSMLRQLRRIMTGTRCSLLGGVGLLVVVVGLVVVGLVVVGLVVVVVGIVVVGLGIVVVGLVVGNHRVAALMRPGGLVVGIVVVGLLVVGHRVAALMRPGG